MSNLPKWISVEENLPDDRQYVVVYSECLHHETKNQVFFRINKAEYISDIKTTIEADEWHDLHFYSDEIKGINSGFFVVDENENGYCEMYLVKNPKYWLPVYGPCDTTTSGQ